MSWQGTLIDEESVFLRGVLEGYRTWCLRYQKIQHLLKALETESERQQPSSKVDSKVQQLRQMTIGPGENADDAVFSKMTCAEAALRELVQLVQARLWGPWPARPPRAGGEGPPGEELQEPESASGAQEAADAPVKLQKFRELMQVLDLEAQEAFEQRYGADLDLKEFEEAVLAQWQEKKLASEHFTKRHAALTGMQYAMKAALARYEWQRRSPEDFAAVAAAGDPPADELELAAAGEDGYPQRLQEDGILARLLPKHGRSKMAREKEDSLLRGWDIDMRSSGFDRDEWDDASSTFEVDHPVTMRALSELFAEGATDPKQREEVLKREHPGSRDHPDGCRACHFQGGLCWKGLSCSFCHICPKPKRKSKHQRDVDKRRQERYRQVKDDLGIECLDELTKIDDSRRQIMTSSEELKKKVKEAYASEDRKEITEAKRVVTQMQSTMDIYHAAIPHILIPESKDLIAPDEARATAPQRAPPPPPPPPPPPAMPRKLSPSPGLTVAGPSEPTKQSPTAAKEQHTMPRQATDDDAVGSEEARHAERHGAGCSGEAEWEWDGRLPSEAAGQPTYLHGQRSRRHGPPGCLDAPWQHGPWEQPRVPPQGWPPQGWGRMGGPSRYQHGWIPQGQVPEYGQFPASDYQWGPPTWGGPPGGWGTSSYHQ